MKLFVFLFIAALSVLIVLFSLRSWKGKSNRPVEPEPSLQPDSRPDERLDFVASCLRLVELGILPEGADPPMPERQPRYDDPEPLGVSFFKTMLADVSLSGLSLPRTFFGRSEVSHVSFIGTDLSESNLCWNDFFGVDFSQANLTASDLRASQFVGVSFVGAVLSGADLRHSYFENCNFRDASMAGTKLTKPAASDLDLSPEQQNEIDWQTSEGEEPDGG